MARPDRPNIAALRLSPGQTAPADFVPMATYGTLATPGPQAAKLEVTSIANPAQAAATARKVALYVFAPGATIPAHLKLVQEA